MATTRFVGLLPVFINNITRVNLQNVTITVDPAKQPVFIRSGLAGFVKGPGTVTLTFEEAIPVGGDTAFDPVQAAIGDEIFSVQIPISAGNTITSNGEFTNAQIDSGINSPTKSSFTFTGTLPPKKK